MPWLRIINPKQELETFRKRDAVQGSNLSSRVLSSDELAKLGAVQKLLYQNYTPLSAFQYVHNSYPQSLFANVNKTTSDGGCTIGIVVKREGREVYYRHSGYCSVSDGIFKKPNTEKEFSKKLEEHSFKVTKENDMPSILGSAYKALADDSYYKDNPGEKPTLSWTEGLFRHVPKDVAYIVIDPSDPKNIQAGFAFAQVLDKRFDVKVEGYESYSKKHGLQPVNQKIISQAVIDEGTPPRLKPEVVQQYKDFSALVEIGGVGK